MKNFHTNFFYFYLLCFWRTSWFIGLSCHDRQRYYSQKSKSTICPSVLCVFIYSVFQASTEDIDNRLHNT